MHIWDVLDKAKEKTGSDNATAKAIGVERAVVSHWRRGKNLPSFSRGVKLCQVAGVDPRPVADLIAKAEREGTVYYVKFMHSTVF